jgi:hypothetical protein
MAMLAEAAARANTVMSSTDSPHLEHLGKRREEKRHLY